MTAPLLEGLKVALVHDWLTGMRGGEKCLEVLCELFPEADLYTLLHQKGKLSQNIESRSIRTSFVQHLPFGLKKYRHYLPLFPLAIEQFDLSAYDLIVSSSHCVAKGVRPNNSTFHISYVHTPMRYVWDQFNTYFRQPRTSWPVRIGAELMRPYLQRWDRNTAKRVDTFLCNSNNIRKKILEYYGRESQVIYPPVDLSRFKPGDTKADYYLMVGAFAPNKRVDLAVHAFNKLKLPLKISGSGQDEEYCRSIAGETIEFLGTLSNEKLLELYQQARALVFPGEDDFGITPLEAQACGTPVIAFAAGGVLETVTDQTGLFFKEQKVEALVKAVEIMEHKWEVFVPEKFQEQLSRFGRGHFKEQMAHAIEFGYRQWKEKF
ncbi:MAG: glycosyltransferase [SAR324 cluster bacterium]|nr:glycosyltransferase [SAR324 cluster bacterium]MEC9360500.1 glycosyltransferase [SAR324 cluster bacterium]MED5240400.1 glycosyltransferase [SAR324 cluster bacterium]MED5516578.1 glycosyltransferase [SAR324 cluster bacterium]MEE2599465.1 glycosyltransferase [SAR324 cluster bacterium]